MMIVTIDGPAGAGKSSAATALAAKLQFDYLDTGATFRALTLAALRSKMDADDDSRWNQLFAETQIEIKSGRVILNGEDVTHLLRDPRISQLASTIATKPIVREHLAKLQREIAKDKNIVCEGRDQGTVVFPNAAVKFFLHADPQERARRRQRQLAAKGKVINLATVFQEIQERDERDATRAIAPLKAAQDAFQRESGSSPVDQPRMRSAMGSATSGAFSAIS